MVLSTIMLEVLLDSAHGELPSDTQTLISYWEILHGNTGEIWKSEITNTRFYIIKIIHKRLYTLNLMAFNTDSNF